MENKKTLNLRYLTGVAMFVAIIVLMAFTPLGYLKYGPVSITFLVVPVAIGACLFGTAAGAVLGLTFGLTSFFQCFGMDAFGTVLCQLNWFGTLFMCVVPRVLIGVFSSLVFRAVNCGAFSKGKYVVSLTASAAVGTLTNTLLFVGSMLLFFYRSGALSALGDSVMTVILSLVTVNSLIELGVNVVLVTVLAASLYAVFYRFSRGMHRTREHGGQS